MLPKETETATCPVYLTAGALREIRQLLQTQDEDRHYLRIGVKGGGCSGFSYIMDFDRPGASDQVFQVEGLSVVMDPAHLIYLQGMEIDFSHGLDNRGFTFRNPNASETCGCGSSFSA